MLLLLAVAVVAVAVAAVVPVATTITECFRRRISAFLAVFPASCIWSVTRLLQFCRLWHEVSFSRSFLSFSIALLSLSLFFSLLSPFPFFTTAKHCVTNTHTSHAPAAVVAAIVTLRTTQSTTVAITLVPTTAATTAIATATVLTTCHCMDFTRHKQRQAVCWLLAATAATIPLKIIGHSHKDELLSNKI